MRYVLSALVLSAVLSAPAAAAEVQPGGSRQVARVVYVCDASAMTRRAFTREFGAMEFVTAEAVAAKGQTWATPKCITPTEARRLKLLATAERQVASLR